MRLIKICLTFLFSLLAFTVAAKAMVTQLVIDNETGVTFQAKAKPELSQRVKEVKPGRSFYYLKGPVRIRLTFEGVAGGISVNSGIDGCYGLAPYGCEYHVTFPESALVILTPPKIE